MGVGSRQEVNIGDSHPLAYKNVSSERYEGSSRSP